MIDSTRERQCTPRDTAVILLAYGSPQSLADVPAYLQNVRGGREPSQALIDEITERYRRIGGRSPLLPITRRIAKKLGQTTGLAVYVGMRHWRPYIEDVVVQMVSDEVRHVIAICMAPHYSALSVGAYRARLDGALTGVDRDVSLNFVESWHTQDDYLAGVVTNVRETLNRFPPEERDWVKVIFTAHSLPASILERGDPYDAQLRETSRLLAERLALPDERWIFSYQSAPRTDTSWLGPHLDEFIVEAAEAGEKNLLVAPIGFVVDHLEVLYDIDIEMQDIAQSHGMRLERTPMLNDSPALVTALANLVRRFNPQHERSQDE